MDKNKNGKNFPKCPLVVETHNPVHNSFFKIGGEGVDGIRDISKDGKSLGACKLLSLAEEEAMIFILVKTGEEWQTANVKSITSDSLD